MNTSHRKGPFAFSRQAFVLGWLAVALGCSRLDAKPRIPWFGNRDKPSAPARLVAVWKDAVLYQPDAPPVRGFGGRLMFYDGKSEEPIRVEGQLVVYAFDEEGRSPTNAKPDRKYVFTREQFAKHYSKSQMGHSYSVWLPWDEAGGFQKKISLIVRFVPVEGDVVVCEQASSVLPGPTPIANSDPKPPLRSSQGGPGPEQEPVRPVAYEATAGPAVEPQGSEASAGRMETYTIPLPRRLGQLTPAAASTQQTTSRQATTSLRRPAPPQAAPATAAPVPQAQSPPRRSTRYAPPAHRAPSGPVAPPTTDRTPMLQPPAG